jgi:tryptophan-rich sensory protein
VLWLAVLWTTITFFRVDRVAGVLFAPYLAWVSFALALNAAIYQLNPGAVA